MIEWIVTSCILILIIIVLRTVLKGKLSLRLQYALWGLVLIRLLVPITFGHTGISVTNLTAAAPVQDTVQIIDDITEISIPSQSFEDAYHEVVQEYVSRGVDISVLQGNELEALDYEAFERMKSPWTVQDILIIIWGIGTGLVALWLLISNLHFGAELRRSRKAMVVEGCTRPVYVTAAVETPCLFGLFRPAIYVTPDTTEDPAQLRHTLQHELTHFRHRDHIWAILRGICLALHWYNPLVWWAASLSRRDAELACDEGTLKRLGEDQRAAYGRTLIAMTCQKHGSLLLTATTMTGSKHSIKERITLIAKKPKMAIYTLVAVLLIATLAVGCTFTGANEPEETPPNDPTPDVTDSLTHEEVILYNCDGLTVAIPKEYENKLLVELGEDKPLISVYEKASIEAAAEHGITDDSLGWIFSLARYDQTDMERYVSEDHSGVQVFAKDESWYYAYVTPTDSTYFPHETTGIGETEWALLNEQVGPSIREDFTIRNGLTAVTDEDMDYPGSPATAQAFLVDFANEQTPATLELAFVTDQGRTVIGKYDAWTAVNAYQYSQCFKDCRFTHAQPMDMTGVQITLTPLDGTWSATFWDDSGYMELSPVFGDGCYTATPLEADIFFPNVGSILRKWYDEVEWAANDGDEGASIVIPDRGQSYLDAALEYCETLEGKHLTVTPGSKYRYTYVACSVEEAADTTEHFRTQGEIGENTYCFYLTTVFVAENERALNHSMAGNTGNYTGSDPNVPKDALEYSLCGYITLKDDGWHGQIAGTGW